MTNDSWWPLLMFPQVAPKGSNASRRCSPWVTDARVVAAPSSPHPCMEGHHLKTYAEGNDYGAIAAANGMSASCGDGMHRGVSWYSSSGRQCVSHHRSASTA